jgi:hypothetical protein
MKKLILLSILWIILPNILQSKDNILKFDSTINTNKHEYAAGFRVIPYFQGNLLVNKTELWFTQSVSLNSRSRKMMKSLDGKNIEDVMDSINIIINDSNHVYLNGTPTFPFCKDNGIFTSNRLDAFKNFDNDLYAITNIEKNIAVKRLYELNSEYWDDSPGFSPDGRTLYFTSDRLYPGTGKTDIFVSRFILGTWSTPEPVKSINTEDFSEQTPSVGPDDYLYYSTNQTKSGNYDIWRVKLNNFCEVEGTPEAVSIQGVNTDEYDESHPVISPAGNWFVFSSNRSENGVKKDFDIYYTEYKDLIKTMPVDDISLAVSIMTRNFDPESKTYVDAVEKEVTKVIIIDLNTSIKNEYLTDKNGKINIKLPKTVGDNPLNDDRIRRLQISAIPPKTNYYAPIDTIIYDIFCKDLQYNYTLIDTLIYKDPSCNFNFPVNRVPFFITGYWCPTTKKYKSKVPCQSYLNDKDCDGFTYEKPVVPCGNNDMYSYKLDYTEPKLITQRNPGLCLDEKEAREHAEKYSILVDSAIDQFIIVMKTTLGQRCVAKALEKGDTIEVNVIGWTDLRPFKENGCLYTGNNIDFIDSTQLIMRNWQSKSYLDNGILKKGTPLKRSKFNGNEMLSDLRAFFTARLLDVLWTENIDTYRNAKSNGQIKLYSEGKGIDNSKVGGYELKRAVDVTLNVPIVEGKTHESYKPETGKIANLCTKFSNPCFGLINTNSTNSQEPQNTKETIKIEPAIIVKNELLPNDCQCDVNPKCWGILVSSTTDKTEAENLVKFLNENNKLGAYVKESGTKVKKYKVRIGCWISQETSDNMILKIKKMNILKNYNLVSTY